MWRPSRIRSKPVRVGYKVARLGVVAYVAVCGLLFFGQRWMVFPGASYAGTEGTRIEFGPRGPGVKFLAADGATVAAVYGPAQWPDSSPRLNPTPRPTVLYFYGNAASAVWSGSEFAHFRRLGCNVLVPDYVGYGSTGGTPTEAGLYATADAAYDYLTKTRGVRPENLVVAGWSLGGAVAIELASRRPVAGVAVFNAFTTLPEVAGDVVRWAPARWMTRYRFDNRGRIASVHCPVLIVNGDRDTLVAPAMADDLAARAGGPVTRLHVGSADHNTIFSADPDAVFAGFGRFVDRVTATDENPRKAGG